MARKNANSSPGVWLGLLLVLVAHALAQSTYHEEVAELSSSQKHDEPPEEVPPQKPPLGDANLSIPNYVHKTIEDDAKDLHIREQKGELKVAGNSTNLDNEPNSSNASSVENSTKSNHDEIATTVRTTPDPSTISDSEAIPTTATIDFEKNVTAKEGAKTVETMKEEGGIESARVQANKTVLELLTTDHREEFTEEYSNFEENTSSELAEATTPSSKSSGVNPQTIPDDSHKNPGHFDSELSDDHVAGSSDVISLAGDTDVNYYKHSNSTGRFPHNDTGNSISDNGVSSGHEPKDEFEYVTDPSVLRISEETGNGTAIDNTTPYYSSSKPKGRTISITGDNDLSTKKPKTLNLTSGNQTMSDTIIKNFPKKSVSTEKPTELKPYPYLKTKTKFSDHELVTENPNKTEESTEAISEYENTIGQKKSGEKIVVTEPSVLVENSIQQFKPVHYKRSGNSSRVYSTFDSPVASTAWSVATTEDLASKNSTGVTEASQTIVANIGNRSQINNDVPQDNPNKFITTERSPVILSEVTENNIETVVGKINGTLDLTASTPIAKQITDLSEGTAGNIAENTSEIAATQSQVANSTEKTQMETVSNGSSTSNEIQKENEEPKITVNQSNVTEVSTEYPISRENISISTEIYTTNTSSGTEQLSSEVESSVSLPITISTTTESGQESSSEMSTSQSTEIETIGDNVANVTGLETIPESNGSTRSITEPTISQTTNVEYDFVELTTTGLNFTVSQDDAANSENTNTSTDFSQTTESQETVIPDGFIEENQTTLSSTVETVIPESQSSTTPSFDTMTSSNNDGEMTTDEDISITTNPPISENSFTTVTDGYTDTTLSSTLFTNNVSNGRIDVTTIGPRNNSEDMKTTIIPETVPPTKEPTTITNIEVIVPSEHTTTSTTVHTKSTSELPELQVSGDVTLFVRVIIEGSWSDVCPVLSNLRLSFANLLTEGTERTVLARNIILHQTQCSVETTPSTTLTSVLLYVVNDNGNFDQTMTELLPSLYKQSAFLFPLTIHSAEKLVQTEPSNNAIAVVAVSSVAFICLVLLAGLLFIMRKRQTRFNYGERCRPVSLDAFRVDSVSAYNSVRRKDLTRASKRSYGNPAFEDSSVTPTHPLNFAGLSSFCNDTNAIAEEFAGIPQVTARMDELPAGAEVKNRYANVAPLPETRVLLQKINNEPLTEYINASYVRGPKNATKYYIACQAPMESTVSDFWRMIWEQQSKVIIMLTDIVENGVEKCVEYIPPSEVTDCHRLYGDYQVTLKKREAKEKYAISTLHLKNLENNTYREVSHIWYLWPTNGVPSNGTGLIAILLEARALQRGAPGPIVIHCSPGTGRTGTLIALDLGIRQYEITRTIDVPRVVYTIRRDRAGAVQTKEQYAFIYKALNLYAAKLAGGALESM